MNNKLIMAAFLVLSYSNVVHPIKKTTNVPDINAQAVTAIQNGNVARVQELINSGFNLNSRLTPQQDSSLDIAWAAAAHDYNTTGHVSDAHAQIYRMLIQAGATTRFLRAPTGPLNQRSAYDELVELFGRPPFNETLEKG